MLSGEATNSNFIGFGFFRSELELTIYHTPDCIGGVMVSILAWSVVDCEFELRSEEAKAYKIAICCFSAKHAALRRKSKDW
jgi:hypothetical protein